MDKDPDTLLNVNEAAALLNISKWTLYGWVSRAPYEGLGAIPYMKLSRSILRFDRKALLTWAGRNSLKHKGNK